MFHALLIFIDIFPVVAIQCKSNIYHLCIQQMLSTYHVIGPVLGAGTLL